MVIKGPSRGTRLWNQSLVCYTFVQQIAAEWAAIPPRSSVRKVPLWGRTSDKERLAAFCCLRNKGI